MFVDECPSAVQRGARTRRRDPWDDDGDSDSDA
jgi:hypothetical protein